MESHELLHAVFKKPTPKRVAKHLNLSLASIHQWSRPRKPKGTGVVNPLDRIAAIWELTRDVRLVEWICRMAGGYFVPNPPVRKRAAVALCMEQNALCASLIETLHRIVELSSSAQNISMEQRKRFRAQWEASKSTMETFAWKLERGEFQPLAHCRWRDIKTNLCKRTFTGCPAFAC